MRRLDHYPRHPGRCAITGDATVPVIDTGRDFPDPRDGHVYIGRNAAEEIARLIGWVKPDEDVTDELKERVVALEALARWHQDQLDVKQRLLDAMFDAGYRRTKKAQDAHEAEVAATRPDVAVPKGPIPKSRPEGT